LVDQKTTAAMTLTDTKVDKQYGDDREAEEFHKGSKAKTAEVVLEIQRLSRV
jgi:hypothetical protein